MTLDARTGSVAERLGVRLHPSGPGADATELLGLALRHNTRRAQLLVSRLLGKHVPTDPRLVRGGGLLLGGLVADALADRAPRPLPLDDLHAAARGERAAAARLHAAVDPAAVDPAAGVDALVLGFAETATGLGHCVADALGADYLHSTRRPVAGYAMAGGFTEEHSHATDHMLLPGDPAFLAGGRPLVLVDDELSTGRTALNTIIALHRAVPRERYVLAALVDVRPPGQELVDGVAALGARLDVVALARASITVPEDVHERASVLRAEIAEARARHTPRPAPADAGTPARVDLRDLGWPEGLPVGGRHGIPGAVHRHLDAALPRLAAGIGVEPGERTLVLGTEELMHLPIRLAQCLADSGADVLFSTSTRSPAVVVDEPGYALRSGLVFPAHDDPADGPGPRYAYNVGDEHSREGDGPRWDHVVVVTDPPADTPALRSGLLAALAPLTRRTTVVITP